MAGISCIVVTPEDTILDEKADFVVVPLFDGELGIGANHSPMIGRLGYGELRLRTGGNVQRFYVDGGFVEVLGDTITVLTNQAVLTTEVDLEESRSQLAEANKLPIATAEQLEIRERRISQARGKIRLADRG
ncbi:MAG: ATP synthase F1 subunit epsilon [Pirellulaceae bacterium]|nr:ATP synthase F1 subunit epsilon [Planctomycetaceae bacterium]HIM28897.1 ATP synthase F1 subunit epsilon [Planctomycetota bacterium]